MSHKHPLLWFARAAGVCLVRPLLRKFTCIPLPFYIRQTAFFLSPTGNLLPVVAITMYVSDSPLFPVAGKVGKRAVFDIRRKGNPKTIGFWWKLPKRRLRQIQRGGFEEVSRFSRHNVAGKRLARRCRLSAAIRGKLYPPEVINHFWQIICLRSSPHKYSPTHQIFTNSSYFSGLVKFS